MNILIVDDDAEFRDFVSSVARSVGWVVNHANDPTRFHESFRASRPDAVILDLHLGKADGVELLRWLCGQHFDGQILLLSGFDARVLSSSVNLGASLGLKIAGAIGKPVRAAELRRVLEGLLASSTPLTLDMLEQAVAADEVELYLQPIVEAATLRISKVEMLSRWRHPTRGLLSPTVFIPMLEQSPVAMDRFTMWAIQKIASEMIDLGSSNAPITVSVNLSAVNLNDLTLPDRVAGIMREANVSPSRLVLEITETAATTDPTATMDILTRLRLKGFGLSLDDFGTGYSSLVALHRLPFTEIKIDRSFVSELQTSREAAAIIKTVADLALNLGLTSVAEGVEKREFADRLRKLGVSHLQGYAFGGPVPMASFFMSQFAPATAATG